ncbi:MAG: hypothetical protein KJO95_02200 [Gammaproteobacteria bacterium]|nr:hypothetical protein [Gammaproteobacteria bacterium]MBU2676093.1 hypothetical protein [Gammaproteobacteria bacterium]NNC56331.1 hypothetical protein [Woeseiaceae bacterium]NNL49829.1 hypothetical protein [Woeseiaceae bacterium]
MMQKIKSWLNGLFSGNKAESPRSLSDTVNFRPPPRPSPVKERPPTDAESVAIERGLAGHVESVGPGKNVLVRSEFVRETGTSDELKILDDSEPDSDDQSGIDPYNTGSFDRSKKWDQRFRK